MFPISNEADIATARQQAEHQKNDDLLGAIEALVHALRRGVLTLPVSIAMPDPPDALILANGKPVIAVEVRRVTWKRLRHVEAHAAPWRVDEQGLPIAGDLIELNPDLCSDEPARGDKNAPRGSRTGNFRAIRKPGENLEGEGWLGGEQEAETLKALQIAVTEKQAKFQSYATSTSRVWLFLIHDGFPGVWENILSDADLMKQVEAICAASDFERVLLFSSGTTEIWSQPTP